MVDSSVHASLPACPRCDTAQARLVARSPVGGVWQMFLCPVCFYSWRSSEPDAMTTREGIAPGFRIDPASIPLGKEMPTVPPLREGADGGAPKG